MRLLTLALVCLGAVISSGCATITSSEMQQLTVVAYGDQGRRLDNVQCLARNDKGFWQAKAPGILSVQRSAEDLMVECKKEGLPPGLARAISRVAAGMFGNIVFGGGVGAIIDHTKGTGYNYPDALNIRMGMTVVVDRRDQDEGGATAAAAAPASLPAPTAPVASAPQAETKAAASTADSGLPASMPRIGDMWKYRYLDGFNSDKRQLFVHEVGSVSAGQIAERMYVAGSSAFRDEQIFSAHVGVVERKLPDATRAEFAPYLQAFVPDMMFASLGDIRGLPRGDGHPWTVRGRVVGPELVIVPSGAFDAIKIELTGSRVPLQFHPMFASEATRIQHVIWYAPKVKRYVKYQITAWDSGGGPVNKESFELVEFKVN